MYTLFKRRFNKQPQTRADSVVPIIGNNAKAKILWVNFSGNIQFEASQAASLLSGRLTLRINLLNNSNLGICESNCSCGCLQRRDADMTKIWNGSIELNGIQFLQRGLDYDTCRQQVLDIVATVVEELHSDMVKMNSSYMAIPINENLVDPEQILKKCLHRLHVLGYSFTEGAKEINTAPEAVNVLMLDENERSRFQTWLNENLTANTAISSSSATSAQRGRMVQC